MSILLKLLSALLLVNLIEARRFAKGPVKEDCLACICQVASNCTDSPCEKGKGCGYFKLTKKDWTMCAKPMGSWEKCAHNVGCSSSCIQIYVALYSFRCHGHSCEHAARLVNGGPSGCRDESTTPFWQNVKQCLKQK